MTLLSIFRRVKTVLSSRKSRVFSRTRFQFKPLITARHFVTHCRFGPCHPTRVHAIDVVPPQPCFPHLPPPPIPPHSSGRCLLGGYSRSLKNLARQLSQNSYKSAFTGSQRPICKSGATVGVRGFCENGCRASLYRGAPKPSELASVRWACHARSARRALPHPRRRSVGRRAGSGTVTDLRLGVARQRVTATWVPLLYSRC